VWSKLQRPTDDLLERVHNYVREVLRGLVFSEFADHPKVAKLMLQQVRIAMSSKLQVQMWKSLFPKGLMGWPVPQLQNLS
jgi:hypothetical protein